MDRKLKKGWWIAASSLLLVSAIQVMLIRESYQYEKSEFVNKMNDWLEKSVEELNVKSFTPSNAAHNFFSVDLKEGIVHYKKDGVPQKFKYNQAHDRIKVNNRIMYDFKDYDSWRLKRLDSLLQQKTRELDFFVPVEYILMDSADNRIAHYESGNIYWMWKNRLEPIKLGFIYCHTLDVNYEFPFGYFWAVAADRLVMMVFLFIALVFCVYWLFRTIVNERKSKINQDKLVHSLVHNLKNPVVSCIAGLNMIKTENFSDKERHNIEDLGEKMKMLKYDIEDLLLADANNYGFRLRFREFDIVELLKEAVSFYEDLEIPRKHVTLKMVYNKSLDYKVIADRGHMLGVLSNLIDNSIKYSNKRVEIVLSLRQKKDHLEIEVKDNGWGVLEEDLKHIFETGYRGVSPMGGYGIGLNYVKMVLLAHRGWVEARSVGYTGSRFVIILPYKKPWLKFGKWEWPKK